MDIYSVLVYVYDYFLLNVIMSVLTSVADSLIFRQSFFGRSHGFRTPDGRHDVLDQSCMADVYSLIHP